MPAWGHLNHDWLSPAPISLVVTMTFVTQPCLWPMLCPYRQSKSELSKQQVTKVTRRQDASVCPFGPLEAHTNDWRALPDWVRESRGLTLAFQERSCAKVNAKYRKQRR